MLPYRKEAEARFPGLRRYRDIHVRENRDNPASGEYYSADETHMHPNPGHPTAWVGQKAGFDLPVPQPGPADIIANDMLHGVLERDPEMRRLKDEIARKLDPEDFRGMYERKLREGFGGGETMANLENFTRMNTPDGIVSGYIRGEPEWVEYVNRRSDLRPLVQQIQRHLISSPRR